MTAKKSRHTFTTRHRSTFDVLNDRHDGDEHCLLNAMPPSTSLRRNATKKPDTSVDELSNKLASGLKISKAEPRRKVASKPTPETQKALSMRAVNAASKSLFEIVESGWKHTPESARGTRFSTANTHAAAAATHLSILRKLCPNDIDIERAALSVLGKLSSLEMVRLVFSTIPSC